MSRAASLGRSCFSSRVAGSWETSDVAACCRGVAPRLSSWNFDHLEANSRHTNLKVYGTHLVFQTTYQTLENKTWKQLERTFPEERRRPKNTKSEFSEKWQFFHFTNVFCKTSTFATGKDTIFYFSRQIKASWNFLTGFLRLEFSTSKSRQSNAVLYWLAYECFHLTNFFHKVKSYLNLSHFGFLWDSSSTKCRLWNAIHFSISIFSDKKSLDRWQAEIFAVSHKNKSKNWSKQTRTL